MPSNCVAASSPVATQVPRDPDQHGRRQSEQAERGTGPRNGGDRHHFDIQAGDLIQTVAAVKSTASVLPLAPRTSVDIATCA